MVNGCRRKGARALGNEQRNVNDVKETLKKAETLGAKVIVPVMSVSDFGLFAVVDIEKLKILGEYSGTVTVTSAGTPIPSKNKDSSYLGILYEDEDIMVDVDAKDAGNEFI